MSRKVARRWSASCNGAGSGAGIAQQGACLDGGRTQHGADYAHHLRRLLPGAVDSLPPGVQTLFISVRSSRGWAKDTELSAHHPFVSLRQNNERRREEGHALLSRDPASTRETALRPLRRRAARLGQQWAPRPQEGREAAAGVAPRAAGAARSGGAGGAGAVGEVGGRAGRRGQRRA